MTLGIVNLLSNFLDKNRKKEVAYVKMLSGEAPIYSQFGNDIYASDVVLQCFYTIIDEMSKLNPRHVRSQGMDLIPIDDDIQRVLEDPNPLMTFSDFMSKFMFNLLVFENSFVYKQYEGDRLVGLYPLSPTQVTFVEDLRGRLYVKMLFKNGMSTTLPYELLIHQKNHFTVDDLMGGSVGGKRNDAPLLEVLKLNDILLQGVRKALKASLAINGIVKYKTVIDDGVMDEKIKEFEDKLTKNQSGFLGIDSKAEYIPLKRDLAIVDEKLLEFMDDKILRNFKTPVEIVRGNYTAEQYEAWYQICLEPYIISISRTFTKSIFTKREITGFKHQIKLYPKELIFMNTAQTLAMVNLLGQSGTLFENEKRVAFGYPPLKELEGVRLQSLNYVNVEYAREYQTQQKTPIKDGESNDS